jgi:hypothetical protein
VLIQRGECSPLFRWGLGGRAIEPAEAGTPNGSGEPGANISLRGVLTLILPSQTRVRPILCWINTIAGRTSRSSRQSIPSPEGEGQGEGAPYYAMLGSRSISLSCEGASHNRDGTIRRNEVPGDNSKTFGRELWQMSHNLPRSWLRFRDPIEPILFTGGVAIHVGGPSGNQIDYSKCCPGQEVFRHPNRDPLSWLPGQR